MFDENNPLTEKMVKQIASSVAEAMLETCCAETKRDYRQHYP